MIDAVSSDKYIFAVSGFYCDFDELSNSTIGRIELNYELESNQFINDWSYAYLGYCIENETQGMEFIEAYKSAAKTEARFTEDLKAPSGKGNLGTDTLYRLRLPQSFPEELKALAKNAANIPVIIEWPGHDHGGLSKVVYLDKHVERLPYPGKFPMTETFITALKELDAISEKEHPMVEQKLLLRDSNAQ